MRFIPFVPLVALLGACSVVPPAAWTFDPTRPEPKPTLEATEAVALTGRIAQLQLERNEIRARIGSEPDIGRRQALYAELHGVGMRLSRLERQQSRYAGAR